MVGDGVRPLQRDELPDLLDLIMRTHGYVTGLGSLRLSQLEAAVRREMMGDAA